MPEEVRAEREVRANRCVDRPEEQRCCEHAGGGNQENPLVVAEVQLEGHLLKETFAQHDLPLNIAIEVGTFNTLKHYVARGLGVAVVSGLCASEEDGARLEIVPNPAELGGDSTYGVVMRNNKHRSALLDDLLRLLGVGGQVQS